MTDCNIINDIYEFLSKEEADLLIEYINSDKNKRRKIAEKLKITNASLCLKISRIKKKLREKLENNQQNYV